MAEGEEATMRSRFKPNALVFGRFAMLCNAKQFFLKKFEPSIHNKRQHRSYHHRINWCTLRKKSPSATLFASRQLCMGKG
ncbi:hypothetical protein SRHO_G00127350 [Serrasalmus rhombeus]